MARNPARSTRGTISGRPAKATRCPRSVSTRAMPRLGGRFPPPDQFSQRILAILALLNKCGDHTANDGMRGMSAQFGIAPQQLPGIDVKGDNKRLMHLCTFSAMQLG